jgi:hypothetical protein
MTVEATQATMDRYFKLMNSDQDFSEVYTPDIRWLVLDTGQEVRGPTVVRDYINELHSKMRGGGQRDLVVADEHAYLEGDGINADASNPGLSYCLVYDVSNALITDMRCYGTLATLMEN